MRYAAALSYLNQIQGETGKLSLENIRRVIERAPFARGGARYVQVAGTNGKGSTSHYIAAILQAAGWRVGLFTSPHLQDVRERIRLDGEPIAPAAFARAISAVRDLSAPLLAEGAIANLPTFFETLFLAALYHFARRRADWVVLEVGLGGRLDATSTVTPEISLITNIAMDHMDILGKTLAAIAAEKAGIARPGVPIVSGCPPRTTAAHVIRDAARAASAPLIEAFAPPRRLEVEKKRGGYACRYFSASHEYRFRVTQRGRHQARNAAMAVAAIDALKERGLAISNGAIRAGIRDMTIPARIEILGGRPPVILDGGHNRAGIRVLTDYLREENIRGFTLLFGVLCDKQYPGMARMLAPLAAHVVLCAPASPRALPSGELARYFPGRKCLVARDPAQALAVAKKFKRTIIGCGSLYLVGGLRAVALAHGARRKKHGSEKVQGPRKAL